MLTLFTTAKPFRGHSAIIQRNALKSWIQRDPRPEVIILGDDEGSANVCVEFSFRHEPVVERTEFGAFRVDDIFRKAQAIASNPFVCYSNCDIVQTRDFWAAFDRVRKRTSPFLLIGKRWDTDIAEPLDFSSPAWQDHLRSRALAQANRRRFEVDYFLFPRGMYSDIPPFGLGRLHWDHWLVWKARSLRVPVIDASYAITAIHQNHDYSHHSKGRHGVWQGPEPERNWQLAGNGRNLSTFEDATHLLTRSGLLLPTPWRKNFHDAKRLSFHIFVHKTLPIRKALGLRKQSVKKLFSRSTTN